MKVFISWSGASSRALAEALADWFPKVIQGVQPFVSAKDIDKGANWTTELSRELADAEFGVLCVAPDNLLSPWLNYEAGAISKSMDSRVCPILLGVAKADVRPPIAQLQMTSLELNEFKLLMASMNKAAGSPLDAVALHEAVEIWWPKLQVAVDAIGIPSGPQAIDGMPEPAQPETTANEMLAELLHRVREMDSRLGRLELGSRARGLTEPGSSQAKFDPHKLLTDKLLTVLAANSITPMMFSFDSSAVEFQISGPLPYPIPEPSYTKIGEIAKLHGVDVRIVGADRTVTFDTSGLPDEPPF